LDTAQVIWYVLNCKYKTFTVGYNITCRTDSKYRTAAALYLTDMVCFRYGIVNILQERGNK
jgi:hypothetical protein